MLATLGDWSAEFTLHPDPSVVDVAAVVSEVWTHDDYRVAGGLAGTVLDLGANVGVFAVLAAKAGAGRVVAVEPDPGNVGRLIAHLAANGVEDRVTVLPVAVAGVSGRAELIGGGTSARVGRRNESGVVTVSLAELVHDHGPVSLLKCDIEGGEFAAFDAAPAAVFEHVERIALEWHGPVLGPHLAYLRGDEFGPLVTKLADSGSVETLGHPATGGLIHWARY